MARRCDLTDIGVMTGNKVSHSNIKTKRKFLPNLQMVALKSDALGVTISLRVASKTLRTINKYGTLDAFLINFGNNKLSDKGKALRAKVKKRLVADGKYADVKVLKPKREKKGA